MRKSTDQTEKKYLQFLARIVVKTDWKKRKKCKEKVVGRIGGLRFFFLFAVKMQ